MDKLSAEQRKRNMQAVRSKDTKIEILLRKALWKKGYRYRKNDKTVFGKPDIVFKKYKTAVFCDSEFWHGKDWQNRKHDHKSNIEYWHKKIERNIERDHEVNIKLEAENWIVLRFWGKEIFNNLESCVNKIENEIKRKQNID